MVQNYNIFPIPPPYKINKFNAKVLLFPQLCYRKETIIKHAEMGKHKKGNVVRTYKALLQNDCDWDYSSLLCLEQKKLKRMVAYFAQSEITEANKQTAKDLTLCVRLLDIVLENERFTNDWNEEAHKCQVTQMEKIPGKGGHTLHFEYVAMPPDFPRYVNERNASRYCSLRHFHKGPDDSPCEQKYWSEHHKEELRKAKAWHLYNLVRECRMFGWWS